MVQMGQQYLNGRSAAIASGGRPRGKFFDLDGVEAFLDWDYAHFVKADLLSRFTAYRQAVVAMDGGQRGTARRGNAERREWRDVQQAVNMAPLGWVPSARVAPAIKEATRLAPG